MFSSFYPSHLNSFGWFPGREGGHSDNTLCRRWSDSHTQLGALNWRVWVASGSLLCNFTMHNLKSACLGPNFLLIKKGKEMFEAKDCFITPTWINGHAFSKSHGKKTLGEAPPASSALPGCIFLQPEGCSPTVWWDVQVNWPIKPKQIFFWIMFLLIFKKTKPSFLLPGSVSLSRNILSSHSLKS